MAPGLKYLEQTSIGSDFQWPLVVTYSDWNSIVPYSERLGGKIFRTDFDLARLPMAPGCKIFGSDFHRHEQAKSCGELVNLLVVLFLLFGATELQITSTSKIALFCTLEFFR